MTGGIDRDGLDLVVVGSGVAGLSAAVRAATGHGLETGIITKGGLEQATTRWAQGGVAAALSSDPEEIDLHLADTLAAGAGLCDLEAVRVLVDEGPRRVEELIALGAEFDRDAQGNLELAREGGHSVARVVHAGGAATGAEIERALVEAVRRSAVVIHEETFVHDLLVDDGRCVGVRCISADGVAHVRARHVLMASGGAGQLYSVTTNPPEATGDGVAAALRAGAAVADLEFVQFHPTALHHSLSPRPLLTEALRGHGAVLRNLAGERFVDELQPRDVVSRAILAQMRAEDADHVWLDATGLDDFGRRFPNIAAVLASAGLDPSRDLLPVHPAAHHLCGGILTDLDGATTLPGLWACGEVACTGVHGANRLASNSLLEGMVFAPRAIEAILTGSEGPRATGAMAPLLSEAPFAIGVRDAPPVPLPEARPVPDVGLDELRARLQLAMTNGAGVERSAASLGAVLEELAVVVSSLRLPGRATVGRAELANLAELGHCLVSAALARQESRGTHWRSDHPDTSDEWRVRVRTTPGVDPR